MRPGQCSEGHTVATVCNEKRLLFRQYLPVSLSFKTPYLLNMIQVVNTFRGKGYKDTPNSKPTSHLV